MAPLEAQTVSQDKRVSEIYIRTTPELIWEALTRPEMTRRYYYNSSNRSDWKPGSRWTSESADGKLSLEGEILDADPPRLLVQTFHVVHDPRAAADPPSRVTWEIGQDGPLCRLTVTQEGMGEATGEYTEGGFSYIISGLKTLLETGDEMATR